MFFYDNLEKFSIIPIYIYIYNLSYFSFHCFYMFLSVPESNVLNSIYRKNENISRFASCFVIMYMYVQTIFYTSLLSFMFTQHVVVLVLTSIFYLKELSLCMLMCFPKGSTRLSNINMPILVGYKPRTTS